MQPRSRSSWALRFGYSSFAALLTLTASPSAFAEEAGALEEIVVTGSYIRRDSFDTASPVDVMTTAQIEEQGTPNLGEILRNSTYNYGVESVTNILAANPQGGATPAANFRGLGTTATLTLLDGRRVPPGADGTSLSNLYPQIMVARVEALTDGAAALYGSDAVGGVLNIIPRKDYEGLEIRGGYNADTEGDWNEKSWSIIGGGNADRVSFVAAFEYRERDELQFFDRPQYSLGAASYSSTSWPGNFRVPIRDATGGGAITPNPAGVSGTIRDPGCGLNNDSTSKADGTRARRQGTALPAFTAAAGRSSCLWEFGENFNYQPNVDQYTGVTLFEYQFSDMIGFEAEILFNHLEVEDRGSPSNPGGRNSELPIIPGEHPGNPYRAFIDADIDGIFEPAGGDQLLFAQDANGDGLPDRGPADALNPLGAVILGGGGGLDPAQGIPFNEDVGVSGFRPVGYPFFGPSRSNSDGTGRGDADLDVSNFRWSGQLNFEVPESSWSGFLRYTYHDTVVEGPGGRTESLSAMSAGLRGELQVRDEATGGSRLTWFNPFTTQNFACVNRDCSGGVPQTDPNQINSPEIFDQIARFEPITFTTTLNVIDLIVTGDVFELPAGAVGLATGVGWNNVNYDVDSGATSNALDAYIGIGAPDFAEERDTYSAFAEVSVPIFDTDALGLFEFSGAVRQQWVEDNSEGDLDHTDYKAAFRWGVRDWLALRGSWSTSFIAPSLADLFDPVTLGLSNVTDRFLGTGAFIARTLGGTATLEPEEADVYNIGFSLRLLEDDLTISFDWKYFDFTDRIIRPIPQEIVDLDRDNALAAGFTIDAPGLDAWLASGMADPRIVRNAANSNIIEVVRTDLLNAQTMEWKGFDASIGYRFDSAELPFTDADFGQFSIGLATTYVDEYNYTSRENGPVIIGAGKRNNGVAAVPASPKWRTNLRLGWDSGPHSVVIYGRHLSEIRQADKDDPFCPLAFTNALMGATNPCPETLGTYLTWDAQYSIMLDGLWGERSTNITVGLINAFDNNAEAMVTLGGLESAVYDPRGQIWYARFTQQL